MRRVNFSESARSSSGSSYPTKYDGYGADYYAVTRRMPQKIYDEDPNYARASYWINNEAVENAKMEAKEEGGKKAHLVYSPTFASAFENADYNVVSSQSYNRGMSGAELSRQYNRMVKSQGQGQEQSQGQGLRTQDRQSASDWAYQMPQLDPSEMFQLDPSEMFQNEMQGGIRKRRSKSRSRSKRNKAKRHVYVRGGVNEGEQEVRRPILSLLQKSRLRDDRELIDGDLPILMSHQRAGVNILNFLGIQETRNLSSDLRRNNPFVARDVDLAAKVVIWNEPVIVPNNEVKAFASNFQNPTILIISGSRYTPMLEQEIADALVTLPKLKKLVFRDYNFDSAVLTTDAIGKALPWCKSLVTLEFDHVILQDPYIFAHLNKTAITSLALRYIPVGPVLTVLFSDNERGCVGKNLTLFTLIHLLDSEVSLRILNSFLPKLSNLLVLQIFKTYFFPDDIRAFCEMLPKLNIKKLDIPFCHFYPQGAVLLAEVLPNCKNLESFVFVGNHIRDEGARAIARVLPDCDRLFYLDLRVNELALSDIELNSNKKPKLKIEL
jgi:hypothetical protein